MIKDSLSDCLKPMVMEAVKECLNIKDNAKTDVQGCVVDSTSKWEDTSRDYASFLEG